MSEVSKEPIPVGEALLALYESLDRTMKAGIEKSGMTISCKKGCSHCCKLLCTATFAEALLIAETLLKGKEWDAWLPKLREAALKTDYPEVENNSYFSKSIPCVFLNEEGACSIYDVRPAACRFHLVVSPPESCAPEYKGTTSALDMRQLEQIVWSMSRDVLEESFGGNMSLIAGPLPLMVLACARIILEGDPHWGAVSQACRGLRTPAQWMKALLDQRIAKGMIDP